MMPLRKRHNIQQNDTKQYETYDVKRCRMTLSKRTLNRMRIMITILVRRAFRRSVHSSIHLVEWHSAQQCTVYDKAEKHTAECLYIVQLLIAQHSS
jgi:hypothetical protein